MRTLCCLAALLLCVAPAAAEKGDGTLPFFNGRDLTGWVNVNCAPGTFFVKDGTIITTGKPTGFLRTVKQYENFILEMEWMHVNKDKAGNSGLFVWGDPLPAIGSPYTRGIEVQVLVNLEKENSYTSHGDVFSIWGAKCKPDRPHPMGWERCLPSERRAKGGGEWNHYKVIGQDGVIKLHVNGKEVSGVSECKPRKGYLALESEGAECHFRNLKIKELPSSNPKADEVATEAKDFKQLFIGDLRGWVTDDATKTRWQPRDWVLHADGKADGKDVVLRTEKAYGDCEVIADFRFPPKSSAPCRFLLGTDKSQSVKVTVTPAGTMDLELKRGAIVEKVAGAPTALKPAGHWNRLRITDREKSLHVAVNGIVIHDDQFTPLGAWEKRAFVLSPGGEMDFANLFVRELK